MCKFSLTFGWLRWCNWKNQFGTYRRINIGSLSLICYWLEVQTKFTLVRKESDDQSNINEGTIILIDTRALEETKVGNGLVERT